MNVKAKAKSLSLLYPSPSTTYRILSDKCPTISKRLRCDIERENRSRWDIVLTYCFLGHFSLSCTQNNITAKLEPSENYFPKMFGVMRYNIFPCTEELFQPPTCDSNTGFSTEFRDQYLCGIWDVVEVFVSTKRHSGEGFSGEARV